MTSKFTKQMWEAAGWTFLEMFIVTLGPSIAVVNVGDWHALMGVAAAAAMSALGAAVSILKSSIVRNIGEQESVFISGGEV